jgi:hypothetical protein
MKIARRSLPSGLSDLPFWPLMLIVVGAGNLLVLAATLATGG